MKAKVDGSLILEEVYNGASFVSPDGETFSVCMRGGGFEFNYQGVWYEAKKGKVNPLGFKAQVIKNGPALGQIDEQGPFVVYKSQHEVVCQSKKCGFQGRILSWVEIPHERVVQEFLNDGWDLSRVLCPNCNPLIPRGA